MMRGSKRTSEAALRSVERRRREDEAPRLVGEVPRLSSLRLEISTGAPGALGMVQHIRRVVVASAPALFEVTCANPSCRDGGHDLTRGIMASLRSGAARFEGSDACHGTVGSAECASVLSYVGFAEYAA